jgi:hypothetical protein
MKQKKFVMLLFLLGAFACANPESEEYNSPENGELDQTFVGDTAKSQEELIQEQKEKLQSEGWEESELENGLMPACYNFKPRSDKSIDNDLEITVGGGTDVAVKLMNLNTETCVRYVFIRSGSAYSIRNIPEGKYYLKIAYGKDWYSKLENGQCIGRFLRNPLYEKGDDIMDYRISRTREGYSIPSFKISLDVVATDVQNELVTDNISEDEFNK